MGRTAPTIASESPGNILTGALWNSNIKAMGDFLLGASTNGVPRFRGYATTAQSLADGTWTSLTIDTEVYDSDNGHSTSSNTSRYVVQAPGTYLISGGCGFAGNNTGNRAVRLTVNGVSIAGSFVKTPTANSSNTTGLVTVGHAVCLAGDYVEVQGWQSSGAALNTTALGDVTSSLAMHWISG